MEMATELGLPGLALLTLFLGGVGAGARQALRAGSPLAPAACAVCAAWLLHASFDWDWQMPAVTLPALILASSLLAGGELGQADVMRQRTRAPTTRRPSRAVSFFP
jgi:O-antigen ligase